MESELKGGDDSVGSPPGSDSETARGIVEVAPFAALGLQALEYVQTQAQRESCPSHPSAWASVVSPTFTAMAVSLVPSEEAAVSIQGLESAYPERTSDDAYHWRKYGQKQVKGSENPHSYYRCIYPNCAAKKQVEQSSDGKIIKIIYTGEHAHLKDDGYHWRKYGQKQVKGSENPRNYYKCTYPNCPTKKQVEQSSAGKITKISYTGEHAHSQPQSTQRTKKAANFSVDGAGQDGDQAGLKGQSFTVQNDSSDGEFSSMLQDQSNYPGNRNHELSSLLISDNDEGIKFVGGDGDEDEPDGKRRRKDNVMSGSGLVPKVACEIRVVSSNTEGDSFHDGYRWRKYGKKLIKGNPHPRSYYKCTNSGCLVRKHVERAPTDPNTIITTCKGKHNHDVTAARTCGNDSSMITGAPLSAARSTINVPECAVKTSGPSKADLARVSSIISRHQEKRTAELREIAFRFRCIAPM